MPSTGFRGMKQAMRMSIERVFLQMSLLVSVLVLMIVQLGN